MAGGGAGRIKGGRHLKYTGKPSMANLLVTLMDKMDVPVDHLGNSTGKLPIDTAPGLGDVEAMRISTVSLILPAVLLVSLMAAAVDPPSVIQAAKNGDKDALRALLQKKADVNADGGRWRDRAALGQLP